MAGEVYDGDQKRWFDVRTRDVRWVDGRDVRLQIATDVTERKATEEIVRQQQEKVQLTVAPDDDGRDGLVAGARTESAADGDHQLQPRHRLAPA